MRTRSKSAAKTLIIQHQHDGAGGIDDLLTAAGQLEEDAKDRLPAAVSVVVPTTSSGPAVTQA